MKKALIILFLVGCSSDTEPVVEKDQGVEDVIEDIQPDLGNNKAPFAFDLKVNASVDRQIEFELDGRDPDGDEISFELIDEPSQGTLIGSPPNLKYKPNEGYVGNDVFHFQTSDGTLFSESAEVSISVTAPDAEPVLTILAPTQNMVLGSVLPVQISASAIDTEDGDISENIKWESTVDGPLGTGASIESRLSIGEHFLRAEIVDSNDNVVSTTVSVEIIQNFPMKILGTVGDEEAGGIGVDELGNVFVAGSTDNSITGFNQGGRDGFLIKYDKDGNEVWKKSVASTQDDEIEQLRIDASGNIFLIGTTSGSIDGGILRGGSDAFFIKYDTDGNILLSKQFGTSGDDVGRGLYIDDTGNIYTVGDTSGTFYAIQTLDQETDGFLLKFDSAGTQLWHSQTREVGKQSYESVGMGLNRTGDMNIYVTGTSSIDFNSPATSNSQLIVLEIQPDGNEVAIRTIGNNDDEVSAAMTEGPDSKLYNAFSSTGFTGSTRGGFDALVRSVTEVGFDYRRELGGEGDDIVNDITNMDGQLYVIGTSDNSLEESGNVSHPHIGGQDIFVASYLTAPGGIMWTHFIGNTSDNVGRRIAAKNGFVYLLSTTRDGFEDGAAIGGRDLLILQYDKRGTRF